MSGPIIGNYIMYFDKVASTMDIAHLLGRMGFREGTVVVANEQYVGRGRNNRPWISAEGGLWLSIILKPRTDPHFLPILTVAFAVAVHETLRKYNVEGWIKWPNDVMVQNKKIAGILMETSFYGDKLNYAVIGVGLNVNNSLKGSSLEAMAVSIYDLLGIKIDLKSILKDYLSISDKYYQIFLRSPNKIIDEFHNRTKMINKKVEVTLVNGMVIGECLGLGSKGELLIRGNNKIIKVDDLSRVIKVGVMNG